MRNPLSKTITTIQPSGIRKFFDIVHEMKDAISLGVGEPDFDTPWHIRDEGIYSLEKGRTFYTSNAGLKELKIEIDKYLKRRFGVSYDYNNEIMVTVGGSEAIDMLQALNTGHDGSLSTGHANSATDMLMRLETMVLMGMELPLSAVRRQIASGVDIIVQLGRLRDKSRKVLEIVEITGYEDGEIVTRPLYQYQETGTDEAGHVMGQLQMCNPLMHTDKLLAAGL